MNLKVYVVKDVPAEQYGPPMVARTELAASRSYVAMLSQGKLDQRDYELYYIGEYDEDTGRLVSQDPIRVTPVYKRDASLEEVI